jgi:aminopeptidase N
VAFAARLVAPAAEASGWAPRAEDGHLGKLKRACLVRLQAHFAPTSPAVASQAQALWDAFFADGLQGNASACPSDFKLQVFKVVLANAPEGSTAAFDQLMAHVALLTSNAERKDVYHAVGAAPSLALKSKVLDWALSGDIKLQDFFYPIGSVSASGPEGLALAWRFFQDHFKEIQAMLAKASASLMDAAIVSSMGGFATEAAADEVAAFFTDQATGLPRLPQSNRKIQQALESIRANAKFVARILASDLSVLGA